MDCGGTQPFPKGVFQRLAGIPILEGNRFPTRPQWLVPIGRRFSRFKPVQFPHRRREHSDISAGLRILQRQFATNHWVQCGGVNNVCPLSSWDGYSPATPTGRHSPSGKTGNRSSCAVLAKWSLALCERDTVACAPCSPPPAPSHRSSSRRSRPHPPSPQSRRRPISAACARSTS